MNTTINLNYKQKKWKIIRIEKNSKKLQNKKNNLFKKNLINMYDLF